MNIQDLGALGEVVGAVAIIVTLLYLATQVRYAKIAVTDQSRQARVTALREINGRLVDNEAARQIFDTVAGPAWKSMLNDLAEAWNVDIDQASLVFWTQNDYIWTHWAQFRSGKTREDVRELENIVATWYSMPPMQTMIQHPTVRTFYDQDFVLWVDSILGREA